LAYPDTGDTPSCGKKSMSDDDQWDGMEQTGVVLTCPNQVTTFGSDFPVFDG